MSFLKKKFFLCRVRKILICGFSKRAGKNSFGRKTIFTQSGGYRLFYNLIDLRRIIADIFILLRIEKNYIYSSYLGFICYSNGIFSYIILSDFINKIYCMYAGFITYCGIGPDFLKNIVAGTFIHHVEVKPTYGAKLMRSAGTSAFIISKEFDYSFLKMKSG